MKAFLAMPRIALEKEIVIDVPRVIQHLGEWLALVIALKDYLAETAS